MYVCMCVCSIMCLFHRHKMETKNSWELSIPTGLHHRLKDHVMVSGTFYVYVHVYIIQYILCTSDVYHQYLLHDSSSLLYEQYNYHNIHNITKYITSIHVVYNTLR